MSNTGTSAASSLIRATVPYTRLPWIRPLVEALATNFASVASLVPGNPADTHAWHAAQSRITALGFNRQPITAILDAQLRARHAPARARDAAATLAAPGTIAVVTGQQAGLFGGPLYTILKAVSTVALARHVSTTTGITTVPIFWVDAEDHDWAEVHSASVLDRDFCSATVTLPAPPGAGVQPVGRLTLDARVTATIDDLVARLPLTEHSTWLRDTLCRRYVPGARFTTAFAGWLDDLLGPQGLVVFEPDDAAAKPLVGHLFMKELREPGLAARLAQQGADRLRALGHAPQIEPGDDVVSLFYLDEDGRHPIRYRDGTFVVGERTMTQADLLAAAEATPERFSPNVLLRPLVQDCLFPTACYVGGPSELAYQAQLSDAYEAFGLAAPLLAARASATLLDSAAFKFLDKQHLPLEALQPHDEQALNRLLAAQLPPELEATFSDLEALIAERTPTVKAVAAGVDPTLAGAVDTTFDRMRDTLHTLKGKIVHGAKRKDDTLRRQFIHARTLAFPGGHPQEREINASFFLNRYGADLPERLLDALPAMPDSHLILVP